MADMDLDALDLDGIDESAPAEPRPDTFGLTLTDQDGVETTYELLDEFDHEGGRYVVLLPPQGTDEQGDIEQVLILQRLPEAQGGEDYAGIESDELLDELFEVFAARCEADDAGEPDGAGE